MSGTLVVKGSFVKNGAGMLQRVRYGYVDSASNYTLTYEGDTESDDILYPGKRT